MIRSLAHLALAGFSLRSDPVEYNGRLGKIDVSPPRIDAELVLDGRLDEPVWNQAARLTGFSMYAPVDGRPASDSTEVFVWYSAKGIHFGIRAFAEPGTVRASLGDRDKSYNDDYIGIFLATAGDGRQATVFAVNPLGVQGDGIVVEGARQSGGGFSGAQVGREPTDISPDYVFQSKGRLTDFGFEVEVTIPFKSLQFSDAPKQTWGINVLRKVQSRGEEHSWAPAKRAAASYIGQFGKLRDLESLDRGLVLDITPILTARADGRRLESGNWDYKSSRPQPGANVRWGLTSNLTLNGTIRPDFAEVESDAGQVVTDPRLALFFPEKRPFFLDGAEQFTTPGGLIYTRQIASPRGAVKVAGQLAGAQVAALVASDARSTSLTGKDRPLFTWLRAQRMLGGSRVGMVYTGRHDGPYRNDVAGADGRIVFGKIYSAQGLVAFSSTDDPNGDRSAPFIQLLAARSGERFIARYSFTSIANDFYTASGFISRDSIANAHVEHGLTFFGKQGGFWQTARVNVALDGTWRYARFVKRGDMLEKKLHINSNYQLRGGWGFGASVLVESFGFDPDLYRNHYVERTTSTGLDTVAFTGTPRLPNLDYVVQFNTPNFQHFSFNGLYVWGKDENFFEWSSGDIGYMTLGADWRPTTQLRVSHSYVWQYYRRHTDKSLVGQSQIPRLKVEYQLSRSMLVRAVGEYQSDRRDDLRDDSRTNDPLLLKRRDGRFVRLAGYRVNQFRPEFLFGYTPVPGTVFFAGYGGTLEDRDAYKFRDLRREQDQLFVKLSYMVRM